MAAKKLRPKNIVQNWLAVIYCFWLDNQAENSSDDKNAASWQTSSDLPLFFAALIDKLDHSKRSEKIHSF